MIVKGIDEKYLKEMGFTAKEVATEIEYMIDKTINILTIMSAGWDAYIGNYVVVRAGGNRYWIVQKGNVMENNGLVSERCLL